MKSKIPQLFAVLAILFTSVLPARAHVGNKDVFEQLNAGPYTLFVTIRPPNVIPGIATIEVRTSGPAISSLRVTPLPLTGEASKHPPTPDEMARSSADPNFFTGSLWLMRSGSWQVRFEVEGAGGPATVAVPVAAAPLALLHMSRPMGALLATLGFLLVIGMAGIVGAAVREARIAPKQRPDIRRKRRASIAALACLAVMALAVIGGAHWWNVEAADYSASLYHSSDLRPKLEGNILRLVIGDPDPDAPARWKPLDNDRLLLDHGHLMHLYAIRMPQMDAAFHLHPTPEGDSGLTEALPSMPPGTYKLFADIVYKNGFPETETAMLTIPSNVSTAPLASEDASATPASLSAGELGPSYKTPDGYTMVWDKPAEINTNTGYSFRFTLLDPTGKPATDMQPYLGMAGHAAFVKTDATAFAHTHPDGSAAMPAVMMANPGDSMGAPAAAMSDMPGMSMPAAMSPTVSFPYGFPSSGRYRIFIQMKHGSTVETGVFDADVK